MPARYHARPRYLSSCASPENIAAESHVLAVVLASLAAVARTPERIPAGRVWAIAASRPVFETGKVSSTLVSTAEVGSACRPCSAAIPGNGAPADAHES